MKPQKSIFVEEAPNDHLQHELLLSLFVPLLHKRLESISFDHDFIVLGRKRCGQLSLQGVLYKSTITITITVQLMRS